MSLLKNLKTDSSIAGEKDSLGGGSVFDSNVYDFTCTMAFLAESKGGALSLNLSFKDDASGKEFKSQQFVTGGKEKGQKNYYEDKKGEKQYLPGFLIANSLAMLTTGKELSDLETEDKVVNIYNFEAKADVPTKVPVVVDLIGTKIKAGIIRQTVNKKVKGDDGEYHETADTRDENEIDKFFCARENYLGMTTSEIKAKAEKAEFITAWTEKNAGKTRDKTKKVEGGKAGAPAKTAAAGGTAKPTSSLFG